jgi:two-component system cell cycle sensor histidine kinase/response regulator CckA
LEITFERLLLGTTALGWFAKARDITEAKMLETELVRHNRLNAVATVAAGIAHDIKNALVPIVTGGRLLLDRHKGDQVTVKVLTAMLQGGERSLRMFERVRELTRGEYIERHDTDISALVGEVISCLKHALPENGIRVQTEIDPKVGTFLASADELERVLMNLCINARDAMPQGGVLSVSASRISSEHVVDPQIRAKARGEYLHISVRDTGTGIRPSQVRDVFQPFFTTKADKGGTGLGLLTVKTIVESYSGFVTFKTELGKGTEFSVWLPCSSLPDSRDRRAEPAGTSRPTRGEIVLLADGDAVVLDIEKQMLEFGGYKVATARSGPEVIAQFKAKYSKMPLLVIDESLPYMSVHAVLSAVRGIAPTVRILMTSATASMHTNLAMGVRLLAKPFSMGTLLSSIDELLEPPRDIGASKGGRANDSDESSYR